MSTKSPKTPNPQSNSQEEIIFPKQPTSFSPPSPHFPQPPQFQLMSPVSAVPLPSISAPPTPQPHSREIDRFNLQPKRTLFSGAQTEPLLRKRHPRNVSASQTSSTEKPCIRPGHPPALPKLTPPPLNYPRIIFSGPNGDSPSK